MANEEIPQEASNIFHSIIKASVNPSKVTEEEIIEAVKVNFEKKIARQGIGFVLVDNDLTPQHPTVKAINEYIRYIQKYGV